MVVLIEIIQDVISAPVLIQKIHVRGDGQKIAILTLDAAHSHAANSAAQRLSPQRRSQFLLDRHYHSIIIIYLVEIR